MKVGRFFCVFFLNIFLDFFKIIFQKISIKIPYLMRLKLKIWFPRNAHISNWKAWHACIHFEMHRTDDLHSNLLVSWELVTGGSGDPGGAAGARPLRVQILSFWHTHFSKRSRLGSWRTPCEVGAPPREILDLSLGGWIGIWYLCIV